MVARESKEGLDAYVERFRELVARALERERPVSLACCFAWCEEPRALPE